VSVPNIGLQAAWGNAPGEQFGVGRAEEVVRNNCQGPGTNIISIFYVVGCGF